jgi:predicted permease
VANLLLARSTARAREFAIRAALGAGKVRVIRQLLTESVLLAFLGGGLGLLLAQWGMEAGLPLIPAGLPRAANIRMDSSVLFFTMAVSIFCGVFFGLAPTLKFLKSNVHDTLKESARAAGGMRHRAQQIFVIAETALALVLLVGAGLMIRSLAALWRVDTGFNPSGILIFGLSLPAPMMHATADAVRANLRQIDHEIEGVHGVEAVSLSWGAFPMSGDDEQLFWFEGQPKPKSDNDMNWSLRYVIEPGYLKTMGVRLQRGRFLTAADDEHSPLAVVIDDVFARKFFPNDDPIGKRINLGGQNRLAEIVGIVGHMNQWGLDSDATNVLRAQIYEPYMQLGDDDIMAAPPGTDVIVRYSGSATPAFDGIRRALQQLNSENTVYNAQTMDDVIANSLATRRISMILLGSFAALRSEERRVGKECSRVC